MFARQPEFDSPMEKQVAILTNPLTSRPYTLERFAADNFRYSGDDLTKQMKTI